MAKPAKTRPQWLLPLILAIAIVTIVGVYAVYNAAVNPMPDSVTLTGTVSSVNEGNVPEKITFTCLSSRNDFVSNVSGGNIGTYSVVLPNNHSYKVTITWQGSGITSETATLDLNSHEASLERNWVG